MRGVGLTGRPALPDLRRVRLGGAMRIGGALLVVESAGQQDVLTLCAAVGAALLVVWIVEIMRGEA